MKRKGFTLVELLVVIAVIALLMGILMPALAKVRQIAQRIMCGTNLSGIGKAMMVYANDYEDDLPRAGRRYAEWGGQGSLDSSGVQGWSWPDLEDIYPRNNNVYELTISCSLYLLVKYADVTVSQFVCNGDSGTEPLELSEFNFTPVNYQPDFPDLWDFGQVPGQYCSYSYHFPYMAKSNGGSITEAGKQFRVSASSNSQSPVCADRNPYLDMNAESYIDGIDPDESAPKWDPDYKDTDKTGNAYAHQREGQNVMFVDSHVEFAKYPNCGISNDHIYKFWPDVGPEDWEREFGGNSTLIPGGQQEAAVGWGAPVDYKDAFLVNEYQLWPVQQG